MTPASLMVRKSRRIAWQSSIPSKPPATLQAIANLPVASKERMDAVTSDELGTEVLSAIRLMEKDFTEKFEDVLARIS